MRRMLMLLVAALTAACDTTVATGPAPDPASAAQRDAGRRDFGRVVQAVEPAAEQECRRRTSGVNCDYLIVIDRDPRASVNAYQSEDARGRPVIIFTLAMIDSARGADELAFIMSHEAAHHIAGHLQRQAENAAAGAAIFGRLASMNGASAAGVAEARQLGAAVGARSYSKDFELEADRLGTVIAYNAGFDPLLGAQYFTRIADPGDRFLGTHPPNSARIWTVRETARQLGLVSG